MIAIFGLAMLFYAAVAIYSSLSTRDVNQAAHAIKLFAGPTFS